MYLSLVIMGSSKRLTRLKIREVHRMDKSWRDFGDRQARGDGKITSVTDPIVIRIGLAGVVDVGTVVE